MIVVGGVPALDLILIWIEDLPGHALAQSLCLKNGEVKQTFRQKRGGGARGVSGLMLACRRFLRA